MTNNKEALKIMDRIADHLIFKDRIGGEVPQLKNCRWNDILLANIVKIGEINEANESDTLDFGMMLISACFRQEGIL